MKPYYRATSSSFLLVILFTLPAFASSDWLEIGRDTNGDEIFYMVERRIDNIAEVWGKRVFSEQGTREFTKDSKENGLNTEGWNKLSHFQSFYEIDCKEKASRVLSVVIYAADGRIVYASAFGEPRWEPIATGSLGAIFHKKICPQAEIDSTH